ncbi:hypothetical protein QJS04_geneDACA005079 [Acorus gramineus]|uniref:Pyruvate phosphate dikinase AMP/ATP-binding domain-containing protein n=1 Tax=Acorus gramineus TaxID=55184 RepID=A0AAV9B0L5_ACOGR|nr:hypothetical protein QJS04_geneDACA005079 [Acorus gramineus]
MSNTLGNHVLIQQTTCWSTVKNNQTKTVKDHAHPASITDISGRQKWKSLVTKEFLGSSLNTGGTKLSWQLPRGVYVVPRAVLATDPAFELAGKFNLDGNSQIQSGSNSFLRIVIDDPEISAIEFLVLDESQDIWFKDNGQNFRVLLSGNGVSSSDVSVPEDLVQIQAFLRWERKGRQTYTPDQQKAIPNVDAYSYVFQEEYEAARIELLEEMARGTSLEEVQTKLIEYTDESSKNAKEVLIPGCKIPDDLVQIQAYVRWEKAGKPNYSPDKQLLEFAEARGELQLELDKGTSLDEIRKKIIKGDVHTKVSRQLKAKRYFTPDRIQRKKRDITQFLNKFPSPMLEKSENKVADTLETPSGLELCSKAREEQDDGCILNKKLFRIDDKEILVLITNPLGKRKILVATDLNGPLTLHWGLSKRAGEWMAPPSNILPSGSVLLDMACQTTFTIDPFYGVQAVDIEVDEGDSVGIPFVLVAGDHWIKNNGSDFYIDFTHVIKKIDGDGRGAAKSVLDKIAQMESEAQKSLMHRFNIAADLIEKSKDDGELGLAGILVWMRFMATRQLTWNKNYNVKPREISKAQDRLTGLLQSTYKASPQYREILRMIMSTVGRGGEGDVGQRIRDEILVIQRSSDCKGGMMEEWHQKLHNNTSPDDVVICQALLDYINSDFDISSYWNTLESNGITKERLLSYDRAIHSEPNFRRDQKGNLLRDLGNYMRTLKAVHSGADLESAISTCMGYKSEGQGFMVGVRINPIKGLPSGFPELLQFIFDHVEDKDVEPLLEGLLEARIELRPLLSTSHDRLRDLIFLDIALDSTVRTAIERGYEDLNNATPQKILYFITLVLGNLALSSDDNEDLIYCLKGWNQALDMSTRKDDQWALYAKSCLDRARLALSSKADHYLDILQPSAEYLGSMLGVEQWAVDIFTEEIIRAGSAASLSVLLNRFDPILRKVAHLGSWQVISPVEVAGYVVTVDELVSVQNKSYEQPTILVARRVSGEEEIPGGTVAVLTPDMPDVLSHVSVRARNCKYCLSATMWVSLIPWGPQSHSLLAIGKGRPNFLGNEIKESELQDVKDDGSLPPLHLVKKHFGGTYAISAEDFTSEMVGAKSRNIAYLKGKVPSWVGIPTSVALPFGVFEKVLSNSSNQVVADKLKTLKKKLGEEDFGALNEIRKTVLELVAPPQLVQELKEKMQHSGMSWPGDEGTHRWEQAWMSIKKVWASKWNERAYFSTRKVKLDHEYLCMAVLVQEIISPDYAFVIHTTNPSSGDSSEIYAEVVKGLGETLVGAYPGRALSFVCKKNNLDSPKILGYPSKPIGLFIRQSIIFRSDSNGEDLEGYAGAGLYDSVPMDEEEKVVLDYSTDRLINDASFRKSILSSIARAGGAIEDLYGSPQDIEGVVKDGKIFVVQTRPQKYVLA